MFSNSEKCKPSSEIRALDLSWYKLGLIPCQCVGIFPAILYTCYSFHVASFFQVANIHSDIIITTLKIIACQIFFHDFLSSDFFCVKSMFSKKFSKCQTVWIQIRPNNLWGLIWVQTVCKGIDSADKASM